MDSLEKYIALIAKENHVSLDRKDSIVSSILSLPNLREIYLKAREKFSMISAEKSKPFV